MQLTMIMLYLSMCYNKYLNMNKNIYSAFARTSHK